MSTTPKGDAPRPLPRRGPRRGGEAVVLLHGEPSWSYLYRHMIPVIAAAGHRAIAPDLVGFGRSDKPATRALPISTDARHVEWMRALLFDVLGLSPVMLVCQDWGGLIGLRLVGEHPERFAPGRRGEHLPAHRGPALVRQFRGCGSASPRRPTRSAVGANRGTAAAPSTLEPGGRRGLRRSVPRGVLPAGGAPVPDACPNAPDDPASEANRGRVARVETLDRPFLTCVRRQ